MTSLTLSLVQSSLVWEDKKANLAMFQQKIEGIPDKTEVVLLPEMFSTGFSMKPELLAEKMDGETLSWMSKIAAKKKIILAGSLIIEENKKYYNRLIWMLPNGEYGTYDKRHLFAYAAENSHYTPGHKKLVASVKGWKINLQICYDLRFPVWSRQPSGNPANQYDLLINIASWPEKRSLAWSTLLRARAIENQCFVAGVNRVGVDGNQVAYSGGSTLIDPLGTTLYENNQSQEEIHTITLQKETITEVRNRFPFWQDADPFFISESPLPGE